MPAALDVLTTYLILSVFFVSYHSKQEPDTEEVSSMLETVNSKSVSTFPEGEGKERGNEAAILASPTGESKRKRGRPAGGSTKKRKITVNQPRRTRTRVGNKAFKIYENNSSDEKGIEEETKSEDDQKDHGMGIEKEIKCEDNHKDHSTADKEDLEIQQIEAIGDSESSCRSKAVQQEIVDPVSQVEQFAKAPDIEMGERYHGQESENPEKLEVMVDPVQAMLLDMIPSLGMKNVETTNPIPEEEKPLADPSSGFTKKKKVSYKDVASELLKDW